MGGLHSSSRLKIAMCEYVLSSQLARPEKEKTMVANDFSDCVMKVNRQVTT